MTFLPEGAFRTMQFDYTGQPMTRASILASQVDQAYVSCSGAQAGATGSIPILMERNTASANPLAIRVLGFTLENLFQSSLMSGWH